MTASRILVVEDEARLAATLQRYWPLRVMTSSSRAMVWTPSAGRATVHSTWSFSTSCFRVSTA
jgi:hypothetical protein